MRILYLNLADTPAGPIVLKALEKKHTDGDVQYIDLCALLRLFIETRVLDTSDPAVFAVRAWLSAYQIEDKIIITTHGELGETETCLFQEEDGVHYVSVKTFAHFLKTLFLNELIISEKLNLSLMMCYAARTREHWRDHDAEEADIDFSKSFAGQLFAEMVDVMPLCLSAYTGNTRFTKEGHEQVQTEAHLRDQQWRRDYRVAEQMVFPMLAAHQTRFGAKDTMDYCENRYFYDPSLFGQYMRQYSMLRSAVRFPAPAEYYPPCGKIVFDLNLEAKCCEISREKEDVWHRLQVIPLAELRERSAAVEAMRLA